MLPQRVKNLLFGRADRDLEGVLGSVLKEVPKEAVPPEPETASYPHLLWAGIAMTILYVVLIEKPLGKPRALGQTSRAGSGANYGDTRTREGKSASGGSLKPKRTSR